MTATIFGAFTDPQDAERAAGALLDHGLNNSDISMLAHHSDIAEGEMKSQEELRRENEIEENQVGNPRANYAYADQPGNEVNLPHGGVPIPGTVIAHGDLIAGGLAPDMTTNLRDLSDPAYTEAPSNPPRIDNDPLERVAVNAKQGISTTTGTDASIGAAKGAAVGLGVGVIAALASVFIPGVGLVVGSGALASAIAGAVGATGAGIIAGGAIGFMKDQGVPDDVLTVYRDAYDRGGAILAVNLPADVDRAEIEAVLAKYGAMNVDLYSAQ
jgi:hypothetical protein